MTIGRRTFLHGAAAGAAVVSAGAIADSAGHRASSDPAAVEQSKRIAFHGEHQSGILTTPRPRAAFLSFDLTVADRAALVELMKTLTDRARALIRPAVVPNPGIAAPSSDSGILGPELTSAGLTITVGLGASAFDERYGLAKQKPRRLRPMDTFPNDDLDRTQCDGDLLVRVSADSDDVVLHAVRDLARHTRGAMQVRWRIDGFESPARPDGASRNLLGFKDGSANPSRADGDDVDALVWVRAGAGEPTWATGGTYHVIRTIRMLVEFWDRVGIGEQERMFGRRKDNGAPLSGDKESDPPSYGNDPNGAMIPLNAHIRMANPRTKDAQATRIVRRSYNYDRGIDSNGNLDMGLVFNCFQADLDRQFVAIQKRLADEPLVDYVSPFGGGYFFDLPGVSGPGDWLARSLLT